MTTTAPESKTTFVAEPGTQSILMTRTFHAPRERVFRALTDPEMVARWWGPARLTNTIERFEARVGGRWHVVQREPGGREHVFYGVFHDSVAPERYVRTMEYEGAPGHVVLETTVLEEAGGGRTTLSCLSVFQSVADRDVMLGGAKTGGAEAWDRLGELVAGNAR
jgi:uncharacterized protein YndB with AHSA1/START domain